MPNILVDIALACAHQRETWGWASQLTHENNEKIISGNLEGASELEATLAGIGEALQCLKRPSTVRLHLLLRPATQAFLEGGACPPGFPQKAIDAFLVANASHRLAWDANVPKSVFRKLTRLARREAEPFLKPEPAAEKPRTASQQEGSSPDRPARAGQSWSLEEEIRLAELLIAGKSFEEISQCLERTRGSIQSRVVNIFEEPFREWLQRGLPTHLEHLRQKARA